MYLFISFLQDIQALPLLSAEQNVEQRVADGIIRKVVSTEKYQYRPFSNQDKGARTIVTTSLELQNHQHGSGPQGKIQIDF